LNIIEFVDVGQVNFEGLKSKIAKDDTSRMEIQEIKNLLGKNIKYFRFHKQISQSELAEKADISVTFLSNIERGKMFPKVETLSRITKSLDVEVFELFRADLAFKENREMISRLSEDITKNVNMAMAEVFKQYLG
jgi:transcriptional regulator with XRE-family HTH domain